MIIAVIFDLDGTLLDRDASLRKFVDDQYERFKGSIGHVQKQEFVSTFIELDARGHVWKDKVYQQLIDTYDLKLFWEDMLQDYIEGFKNHCVPFENLTSMLDELKSNNIRLGMITNGKGQFQLDSIKALGIEQYFDTILISELEGLRKPDRAIFEKALAQLNARAENSLFVGDHPDHDIKAAKNCGMATAWKRDEYWSTAESDFIIEDLGEIPGLIHNRKISGGVR